MTKTPRDPICLLALVLLAACRAAGPAPDTVESDETLTPLHEPASGPSSELEAEAVRQPSARPAALRWASQSRPLRGADYDKPVRRSPSSRAALAARADLRLRTALDSRIPGLRLTAGSSLRDAGALLSRASGIDIVVDPRAEDALADSGNELELDLEHPVRLRSALNLLTDMAGDDIAWKERDGFVYVTTKERARGKSRTFIMNVSDLLYAPPNFAAPELGVRPSGSTFELPEAPERVRTIDEDMLIDAIRAAVAPGTWDEDGNSIEIVNGKLFITHD